MSGTSTIATTEPMLGSLRVQTSMYGLAIPLAWGTPCLVGNLVWFNNFQAIAHTTTTSSGGKGGGGVQQVDTKWEYRAAAALALCRGPVNGIASAWQGKNRITGTMLPTRTDTASHTATVPASPYQITVPGAANYLDTIAVTVPGTQTGYGEYTTLDEPTRALVPGQHYTVAAGVYTFLVGTNPDLAGAAVNIAYRTQTPASWASALDQLGLSLASGLVGQPVWSWLASTYPAEALAYSGLAYVYDDSYQLTSSAEVDPLKFEVVTGRQVSTTVPDADPSDVVADFLTNPYYGAGWRAGRLAALTSFRAYVRARQLWLSPSMTEQRPAREWLEGLASITNAQWVWQGGQLDLVPRGDEALSSAYGTYTPDVTPVFDLVHGEGGDLLGPVEIEPVVNEDAKNIIRIEWTNRANGYTIEIMDAKDAAHIELFGERPAEVVAMHAIHDASVAQGVAQQLLQREMTVWNTYTFRTPWTRALMGLMSLATLTDADSALSRVPVRILKRREKGKLEYEWEAEDAPIGAASAPLYGTQAGAGYAPDFNAAPGNVATPLMFEAPVERTTTGLEVYAAVSGTTAAWGGCTVWVSLDGTSYKQAGRMHGGSRYGTLTSFSAAGAASVAVQLAGQGGQMLSGTLADAQALNTLLWINGASDGGEYLAHQTATLTGANAYTLSGLQHGAFGTTIQDHAHGSAWARVDDALATSGPLDVSFIGKTIYFKFTSFNVYEAAEQLLSDVSAYSYTITGGMAHLPPPNFDSFALNIQPDGTRQFTFAFSTTARPNDFLGAQIRYVSGIVSSPAWATMKRLDDLPDNGFYSQSPAETNQLLAGAYTFALCALDTTYNAAKTPLYIQATLPDRRLGNVLEEYSEGGEGWTGTKSGCAVVGTYLEATDSTTWATLPATWAGWTRWNMAPASPITYTGPVRDLGLSVGASLNATADADGTVVQELRTSSVSGADCLTQPWVSAGSAFNGRWLQVRITITATGPAPVPALRTWTYSVNAAIKKEYLNDQVISGYTGGNRIATGDVRIPVALTYAAIKRVSVVVQDSTATSWTWALLDKTTTGPRVQFRAAGVLADPAKVDFYIEGA